MKTAISIPAPIFHSAEVMAQHLAISRSELFTKAISEYLQTYKYLDVIESLNKDSVVNVSQLITLDKSLLTESIGKLTPKSVNSLNEGIKLVLGIKI